MVMIQVVAAILVWFSVIMVPVRHAISEPLIRDDRTESPEDLFQRANQAFIQGEYMYAAELYEEILAMGLASADLFYNLGNAYFKENQIGMAILNYERALQMRPFDENILFNLELARSRTVDRIEPLPQIFYQRWWKQFIYLRTIDGWARIALVFMIFSLMALLWFFFSNSSIKKKAGFALAMLLLLFSVIFFYAAHRQYILQFKRNAAIVMAPRVVVKSAPGETSPDLFVIHEGTKLFMGDDLGEWTEIRLENGNTGWLKRSQVMAVRASAAASP